jgi:hypothetical protein
VRWVRAEVWDSAGQRIAWGHGDEHGQVTLVIDNLAASGPNPVPLAVRIYTPGGLPPSNPVLVRDPLADLPVETLPRAAKPTDPVVSNDDVTLGLAVPAGYRTEPQDAVINLTVGTLTHPSDIELH